MVCPCVIHLCYLFAISIRSPSSSSSLSSSASSLVRKNENVLSDGKVGDKWCGICAQSEINLNDDNDDDDNADADDNDNDLMCVA